MSVNAIQPQADRCPLCGDGNHCQLATTSPYKGPCWCQSVDLAVASDAVAQLPETLWGRACLCRNCLEAPLARNAESVDADFYTDDLGRVVFTAAYLRKRGWCCGNGCRHCPY